MKPIKNKNRIGNSARNSTGNSTGISTGISTKIGNRNQPTSEPIRCPWCLSDELSITYHDKEWGVPLYDDDKLFEALILEGAQAGLSWSTVLKKREAYRAAFHHFEIAKNAKLSDKDIKRHLLNPGLIRHAKKIESVRNNAQGVLSLQKEFGSFSNYCWSFVNGVPQQNRPLSPKNVPTESLASRTFSQDLKQRGFQFVGPRIIYAFMQAVGMVNDHLDSCFRVDK